MPLLMSVWSTSAFDPLLPFRVLAIFPIIDQIADIRREARGDSR